MATREENLKKINEELELLSDEELEQVAGGTYGETASDSRFLFDLGLLNDTYSSYDIMFSSNTNIEKKIYDAYAKVGIGFGYHGVGQYNNYYFGQECLTQSEAWKVAESQAKRLKLGKYSK